MHTHSLGNTQARTTQSDTRIMTTALITHATCLAHQPPAGHPESPARLAAVLNALRELELTELAALSATPEQLAGAHSPALVDAVLGPLNQQAQAGYARIDADTFMSAGSAEAALRAAGAA